MDAFREFLRRERVLYAVVASPDGKRWEEYGDRSAVPYVGIVEKYFSGPGAMSGLDEYLRDQILPKTIMQGEVVCVICRPASDVIVGMYVRGPQDPMERILKGRSIGRQAAEMLSRPT